jgi:hypothetical protein
MLLLHAIFSIFHIALESYPFSITLLYHAIHRYSYICCMHSIWYHSVSVILLYSSHDLGNGLADTNTNMFPDVDSTWKVSFILCIA